MHKVNIHEAKTHLSQLINEVLAGEDVVISKAGKPVVILKAYEEPAFKRKGGQFKGILKIGKDFDSPLPEEITKAFEGKSE